MTRFSSHEVPGCGWIECRTADEDAAWRDVWQRNVYQLGLPELDGTNVLDIGSNIGFFTAFALYHGAVNVVAVDPVQEHHDRAAKMLGNDGRVQFVTGAAGDGLGRTFGPGEGPSQTMIPAWTNLIRGYTLDELVVLLPDDERATVCKVDCEGCEFDLFDAASDDAVRLLWRIAMEWHGQMGAVRESAAGKMARLVERLIYTHSVTVFGDPAHGGMLFAYRY